MATAKQKTHTVEKVVTTQVEVKTFTLELTESEAATLFNVTVNIGGLPSTRRGDMDSIRAALLSAEFDRNNNPRPSISGCIYFN